MEDSPAFVQCKRAGACRTISSLDSAKLGVLLHIKVMKFKVRSVERLLWDNISNKQ
jgi:flavoprotein